MFSAAILAAIEEDLGTPVIDHFDLIAGTSTGGIIAIALGLGIPPKEIVEFYIRWGPEIFSNPWRWRSVLHWFGRKYSGAGLDRALRAAFGQRTFGESRKRLVIPAYNTGVDDVYVFRTPHLSTLRRDYRCLARDVALATSAAPTYFTACRSVDGLRLIDGGVWANNPAMVALAESYGPLGVPLERTWMLSVGTYDAVARRPFRLDAGGLLTWARTAPDVIVRASSIGATNQVRFFLTNEHVVRLDPKVPEADVSLDRIRAVDQLLARARHHSRSAMPTIAETFVGHTAMPYEPLYRT